MILFKITIIWIVFKLQIRSINTSRFLNRNSKVSCQAEIYNIISPDPIGTLILHAVNFQYWFGYGSNACKYFSPGRHNLFCWQQETIHSFVWKFYRIAVFYSGFPFGPVVWTPLNKIDNIYFGCLIYALYRMLKGVTYKYMGFIPKSAGGNRIKIPELW